MKIKIAPSILSADFSRLGEEIKNVEKAGADWIHVDVMDGHFVPNITMGPMVVKAVKKATKLPVDVHLMISDPAAYIEAFAKAGSDIISFHIETVKDPVAVIDQIKKAGKKPAIAINPDGDVKKLAPYLDKIGMVLVMTVFPGFEKQEFITSTLPGIVRLRSMIDEKKANVDIEVDGGMNPKTSKEVIKAGANVIVAGSAVFYSQDYKQTIDSLREHAQ